ncbi:MAG: C40 family peptidase [Hymenobacteraceae bacterium]|nr:C40 family peptidase [Hymenobacteraceae bacterium]
MLLTLRSIWIGAGALIAGTLAVGRLTNFPADHLAPAALTRPTRVVAVGRSGPQPAVADSVVAVGLRLRGAEYHSGGTTPEGGFDCSGFVRYCFAQRGVAVPPSSTLQAQVGREVPRAGARPGDIVIFTGTDVSQRSPGHTGIVISQPGKPLRFVHSSSARKGHGVKVSQVDSTRYEERLLSIRRVVEDGTTDRPVAPVAPMAAAPPAPRPAPVAELDPLPVAIVVPKPEPAPRVVRAAKAATRRTNSRTRSTRRHRATVAPKNRTARTAAAHAKSRVVHKQVTKKPSTDTHRTR